MSTYTLAQLDAAAAAIAQEAAPELTWSPRPQGRGGLEAWIGDARVSIYAGQERIAGLARATWAIALDLPAACERVIHREPATPAGALASLREVICAARAYDRLPA